VSVFQMFQILDVWLKKLLLVIEWHLKMDQIIQW
jgi:hypothetical protein